MKTGALKILNKNFQWFMVYIWVCSLHKVIKDSEYTNVPIDDTCVCFLKLDSSSSLSLSQHSSTILLEERKSEGFGMA